MDGIKGLANGISEEMRRLLPGQRKTQRENLALLVATMLDVRSANLCAQRQSHGSGGGAAPRCGAHRA